MLRVHKALWIQPLREVQAMVQCGARPEVHVRVKYVRGRNLAQRIVAERVHGVELQYLLVATAILTAIIIIRRACFI